MKVTDGAGTNAWTGGRPGMNYRATRAVAWLMAVGNGQWIVRYRNKASRPMKLPKARKYAVEMVKGICPGRIVADPIAELNRMQCIVELFVGRRQAGGRVSRPPTQVETQPGLTAGPLETRPHTCKNQK